MHAPSQGQRYVQRVIDQEEQYIEIRDSLRSESRNKKKEGLTGAGTGAGGNMVYVKPDMIISSKPAPIP